MKSKRIFYNSLPQTFLLMRWMWINSHTLTKCLNFGDLQKRKILYHTLLNRFDKFSFNEEGTSDYFRLKGLKYYDFQNRSWIQCPSFCSNGNNKFLNHFRGPSLWQLFDPILHSEKRISSWTFSTTDITIIKYISNGNFWHLPTINKKIMSLQLTTTTVITRLFFYNDDDYSISFELHRYRHDYTSTFLFSIKVFFLEFRIVWLKWNRIKSSMKLFRNIFM